MKHTKREIKGSLEFLEIMSGEKKINDCKVIGKKPKKKQQHEAKEQEALFQWAHLQKNVYPDLEMLFAIPNGGSRHKLEAYALKRQGVKAGVPDMFLAVAKGKYHGLFIELKAGSNKASDKQKIWIDKLKKQNYKAVICYGFDEAQNELLEYISQDARQP